MRRSDWRKTSAWGNRGPPLSFSTVTNAKITAKFVWFQKFEMDCWCVEWLCIHSFDFPFLVGNGSAPTWNQFQSWSWCNFLHKSNKGQHIRGVETVANWNLWWNIFWMLQMLLCALQGIFFGFKIVHVCSVNLCKEKCMTCVWHDIQNHKLLGRSISVLSMWNQKTMKRNYQNLMFLMNPLPELRL